MLGGGKGTDPEAFMPKKQGLGMVSKTRGTLKISSIVVENKNGKEGGSV